MSKSRRRSKPTLLHEPSGQTQKLSLIVGGVAIGLLTLVTAVYRSGMFDAQPTASTSGATCSVVQTFVSQGATHIRPNEEHPPYSSNPPTSGWHWDTPQDWGIYTTPQIQEQLVHNLEHGGIVVQYNNLTQVETQRLTDLIKRDSYHMILAPNPGLPANVKIAFTAWMKMETCDGINETALNGFVNAYRDQGPERVP